VLATLRRAGPPYTLRPSELTQTLMLTSSGTTKRLDRLERAGLIARTPDPSDRRGVLITLTDAGFALHDRAIAAHVANEHRLLSGLGDDEREQLAGLLRKLQLRLPD
jgi:DNA-binding MarR family transcriptional regulator